MRQARKGALIGIQHGRGHFGEPVDEQEPHPGPK